MFNPLLTRNAPLNSEAVHAPWMNLLPDQPGLACDIGASSDRDACWPKPALLNEWVYLMQSWNHLYDLSIYDKALQ